MACAVAVADSGTQTLEPVVVTATRTATPISETPAAIDRVDAAVLDQDRIGVNLSEMLGEVPGTLVRDRQNYAQDEQASIRGFGTRSPFGIVGVKIYVDGIPATRPDGQGQVSQLNLDSADRVEVLRGPFSALYGNSAGGVIQVFTAPGQAPPEFSSEFVGGSYGQLRGSLNARGAAGPFDYNLDFTHFETDGVRDHSAARRESGNLRLGWHNQSGTQIALVANTVSIPESQDPLGLTRAQFEADPRLDATTADLFNTRKSVEQTQAGLVLDQSLGASLDLHAAAYFGHRAVRQFLAVPTSAEASPTSSGGVVALGGDYGGTEIRLGGHERIFSEQVEWVTGLSYDRQNQARFGYNNFIGDALGVQGTLRRDENDNVFEFAPFAQGSWDFAKDWRLQLGVRRTEVRFVTIDHYVAAGNPDDSGRLRYDATTPVAGLLYRLTPQLHLYTSWGEGFDAPTFNELAYRPDGGSGLNTDLQAARTGSGEFGAKYRAGDALSLEAAAFESLTRHDLVVDLSQGGRTTYRNADRSRRRGLEAGGSLRLISRLHLQVSATYLDAVNRVPYLTCSTTSCTVPNTLVAAGDRIAGVAPLSLSSSLRWGGETGWIAGIEGTYLQRVPTDSANQQSAPDYGLVSIDGGYIWQFERVRLRGFLRLDNLLDQQYIGSVIVNESHGQYFEPGPGRSIYGGFELRFR